MKRILLAGSLFALISTTCGAGEIYDLYVQSHSGTYPISSKSRSDADIDRVDSDITEVGVERRSEALPQVRPMRDFVRGYEAASWFGIGAPRGTPPAIINRLNREINAGLTDPGVRTRVAELGGILMPGSPGAFAAFMAAETEKYRAVILAAKIKSN